MTTLDVITGLVPVIPVWWRQVSLHPDPESLLILF
jgi:hypothetical protein